MTSSITMSESDTRSFADISTFLTKHRVSWYGRVFTVSGKTLTTGLGTSYARWNGHWIKVTRSRRETKFGMQDEFTLVFWTRSKKVMQDFIDAACTPEAKEDSHIDVRTQEGAHWHYQRRRKRDLSSVFVNNNELDPILKRIDNFRSNEKYYLNLGIPYKLCIILHGQPGTGKTSLLRAIASQYKYDVYVFNSLASISRLTSLDEGTMSIIEDIDTLGNLTREKSDDNGNQSSSVSFSLHDLLNALDGFSTPHGSIIVLTTNKINSLDPALVRKGRADLVQEISYLKVEAMTRMFVAFYGEENRSKIDQWVACHGEKYKPTSGAELQDLFFTNTVEESLAALSTKFADIIDVDFKVAAE